MTMRSTSWLLGLSLLGLACGDDGTSATGEGDSSGDSGPGTSFTTASTVTMTTSLDDTGTSAATSDTGTTGDTGTSGDTGSTGGESTGADSTSEGSTGGSSDGSSSGDSSSGGMDTCGNDMIDGAEVCDGIDVASQDCTMQGFDSGTIGCLEDCSDFDLSGCTLGCGNNLVEAAEVCDGTDLEDQTCLTQNFGAGTLGCAGDCTAFDTTACIMAPACVEEGLGSAVGPAVAMGNTDAEDEDLDQSCNSFNGGVEHVLFWVAPADGWYVFDTAGSTYDTVLAIYSDCDSGNELSCNDDSGGSTSSLLRNFTSGQQIVIAVSGFNGSTGDWVLNINEAEFAGPCCDAHNGPGCWDDACTNDVCQAVPGCCVDWNLPMCAGLANVFCDVCTTEDICGNNVIEGNEMCDGSEVGGETCQSQGFDAGMLVCNEDCGGFDTSGCFDYVGNCCAPHGTPGCMDETCTSELCMADPFCCEAAWDGICSDEANVFCDICNTPDVCGNGVVDGMNEVCDGTDFGDEDCTTQGHDGGQLTCNDDCTADDASCLDFAGDCCVDHGGQGCDDDACWMTVCAGDPFCCNVSWDFTCAGTAQSDCNVCQ